MKNGTVIRQVAEMTDEITTDTDGAAEWELPEGSGVLGLLERARLLIDRGVNRDEIDPHKALDLLHEAHALLTLIDDVADPLEYRLLAARCHTALSRCHERLSHYDPAEQEGQTALRLLEEAETLARTITERHAVTEMTANACAILGNIYDRRSDFARSLEYRQRNLDIAVALGDPKRRGHALLQSASAYYRLGDYPTALTCYLDALTVFQDTDDLKGHGSAWNGIGNVQFSERDHIAALESYRKGLEMFEQLGDPYWEAGLLGNIASILIVTGDLEEASHCFEQSLTRREGIEDRHGQAFSLNGLAEVALRRGDTKRAQEYSRRAIALLEVVGDRAMLAQAHYVLSTVYETEGRNDDALMTLIRALELAEETRVQELIYQFHEKLSGHYERRGDLATALRHYKQFHEEKNTLFSEERERKLRGLQVRHQLEQAQREATIYRCHNAELEQANARQALLVEQLQRQSELLERQARTDGLTGLINRRYLEVALSNAFDHARRWNRPLTIAIADIDNFKRINDTFSHPVGDAVLRSVARLLQQNCRRDDVLARYGGEEFVLVLPGAPLEDAMRLCERMRELVEAHDWSELHSELRVTMSFGLCVDSGHEDPERMLSQADARLYEAKARGRNCVCS